MKLQHIAIIFVIIILPISLVLGEYIASQIDTIYLQTMYSQKLQDATYDAIKAFQLNTVNNKYSSVSDSKIRDIEASISTFYNSLGTAMGASGYDQDSLKDYIPAMVYTMYDGYYVYGKYFNYEINQYQYGLKPYIYYSCRYRSGADDFVVNYTLDNSITIYGKVNGEYVTKSGYVINPNLVTNIVKDSNGYAQSVIYDGILIEREILEEQLITINDEGVATRGKYQYTKYNNQKIYKDGNRYFINSSNKKAYLTDEGRKLQAGEVTPLMYAERLTANGNLYSNSGVEYYVQAYEFSTWINNNLGNIKQKHAIDSNGNTITNFASNTEEEKIFNFSAKNNPLVEGSTFNENRISVIRKTIETNLSVAIANYNSGSSITYKFEMPIFNESDWDKLLNNISIAVFMQGMPIKAKYFNSYCIITNDKNEEVVAEDGIYVIAQNDKGTIEAHEPGCEHLVENNYNILGSYNIIDFERQTVVISENNEVHYYPKEYAKCYKCIVNASVSYEINDIIEGKLKKYNINTNNYEEINEDITKLRKIYLTGLGRERYDLYRTNGYFNIE